MIDRLLAVAPARPWVVLPLAAGGDWSGGHLDVLDWLLHDPARCAIDRGFFAASPGETLAVQPAVGGFAGLLLVGYRSGNRTIESIAAELADALPAGLLHGHQVMVLPPEPYDAEMARQWRDRAAELTTKFAAACPDVAGWMIEDLLGEYR